MSVDKVEAITGDDITVEPNDTAISGISAGGAKGVRHGSLPSRNLGEEGKPSGTLCSGAVDEHTERGHLGPLILEPTAVTAIHRKKKH